jgi:hypothetical protein
MFQPSKVPAADGFLGDWMHTDAQTTVRVIRDVRCACVVCGAHVLAWEGHELSGWCSVCGSYELRPLPSCDDGLRGQLVRGLRPVPLVNRAAVARPDAPIFAPQAG